MNIIPNWSWTLAAIVWITFYLQLLLRQNNKTSLLGMSDAICTAISLPYSLGLILYGFRINPMLFLSQSILVLLCCLIRYEAIRVRTRMAAENEAAIKYRDPEDNQANLFGNKFLERTKGR